MSYASHVTMFIYHILKNNSVCVVEYFFMTTSMSTNKSYSSTSTVKYFFMSTRTEKYTRVLQL